MESSGLIPTPSVTTLATTAAATTSGPQMGSQGLYALLASTPGAVAALAVGVVVGAGVVTVAGVALGYKFYKDLVDKAFFEKVKYINSLHLKHLTNIVLYGKQTKISLPPIFSFSEDEKSVDAIHFTDDILRAKGTNLPRQTARSLSKYKECIFSAILLLRDFYFSVQVHKSNTKKNANVKEKNGITRAVISYLIEMLDSHCLKFQGYDYDIGVLRALTEFLSEYSSRHNTTATRDFSRLANVCRQMDNARKHLEIHKQILSLQEIMSDLNDDCRDLSDGLIRSAAILINETVHREYISHVLKEVLAEGKLKIHHIKDTYSFGIFGTITTHDDEVLIKDTPFRNCLINLAKYALKVIDSDLTLREEDIDTVNIAIPDIDRFYELKNKKELKKSEIEEKKLLNKKLNEIRKMFKDCNNFITKKLFRSDNSDPVFIPIVEEEDYRLMVERTKIIDNFIKFTWEIITLNYYTSNFEKSLALLGEIYMASEENERVFRIMNKTFGKIIDSIKLLRENFDSIDQAGDNYSDLDQEKIVRKGIDDYITKTEKTITTSRELINNYKIRNKGMAKKLTALAKGNLYTTTDLIEKVLMLGTVKQQTMPIHRAGVDTIFNNNAIRANINPTGVTTRPLPLLTDGKSETTTYSSTSNSSAANEKKLKHDSKSSKLTKVVNYFNVKDSSATPDESPQAKRNNRRRSITSPKRTHDPMARSDSLSSNDEKASVIEHTARSFSDKVDCSSSPSTNEDDNYQTTTPETLSLTDVDISIHQEDEIEQTPEVLEIDKSIEYLTSLKVVQLTINSAKNKIPKMIQDLNANEMQEYFSNLISNLECECKVTLKMINEDEKDYFRHTRIIRMLNLLKEIADYLHGFFNDGTQANLENILEIISSPRNSKFIDAVQHTSGLWSTTPSRKNLNNLGTSCNKIINLMSPVVRINEDRKCC